MPKYAISDIHGACKTFQAALDQIGLNKEDHLYLLGDYIDRGPDSKGVIDTIWQLQSDGYQVDCLKGNHEAMVADQYLNPASYYSYQDRKLMQSFGVSRLQDLPAAYVRWMDELPHYLEVDQYLLTHAGMDSRLEDPFSDTHAMLWMRSSRECVNREWLNGRIIVHGHTPVVRPLITYFLERVHEVPDLNIDNGCVFGNRDSELGSLCILELETQTMSFVKCVD